MTICFKEVGQGDSIIIEWVDVKQKIGLIDVNLKPKSSNPALNHLISAGLTEIEFLILSHPHSDHFSGMRKLLEYCREYKIHINYFLHTSANVPEWITSSVTGDVERNELGKLFNLIEDMNENGEIENCGYLDNTSGELNLGTWKLRFLAPTSRQYKAFKAKKYTAELELKINSSAGNLLSTVIEIYNDDNSILLTSDAVDNVFKMIYESKMITRKLLVGQISHHGAKENFYKEFWRESKRVPDCPAVISVGDNPYNHPAPYVINYLEKVRYKRYLTNEAPLLSSISSVSGSLNLVSSVHSSSSPTPKSGDVTFTFP
ncbi:MAG TPA: hypothetical protein VHB70_18980 [Parafilimonas sp.]|nr:hypothetical protein [Parafilimonas sp.]